MQSVVWHSVFYLYSKRDRLASGTKSFSCVMAVAAVEDGLLQLDEPVAGTIIEWQGHLLKARAEG